MLRDSMRWGVCQCHAVTLQWAAGQRSDAPLYHHYSLARHYQNSPSGSYVSWTPELRKEGFWTRSFVDTLTLWILWTRYGQNDSRGPRAARLSLNLALWTWRDYIDNGQVIKLLYFHHFFHSFKSALVIFIDIKAQALFLSPMRWATKTLHPPAAAPLWNFRTHSGPIVKMFVHSCFRLLIVILSYELYFCVFLGFCALYIIMTARLWSQSLGHLTSKAGLVLNCLRVDWVTDGRLELTPLDQNPSVFKQSVFNLIKIKAHLFFKLRNHTSHYSLFIYAYSLWNLGLFGCTVEFVGGIEA